VYGRAYSCFLPLTATLLLFPQKVEGLETFFKRKQCSRHTCIPHPDLTDEIFFICFRSLVAAVLLLLGGGDRVLR
jgi:hypothetical protein